MPELDPTPAENAKASAELAIKSGDRLSGRSGMLSKMMCMQIVNRNIIAQQSFQPS